MTVYHGSYAPVSAPLVSKGRAKVDFGQGFYLTKIKKQAESWARTIASRKGRSARAYLSEFTFDLDAVANVGFRVKVFPAYDLEWLEYVVDCRRGGTLQLQYDVVEGGVANDNVIDTVEDYEKGVITAEQALGQLRHKEVNHQLCVRNQDVIFEHLTFIASTELPMEGA